MSGPELPFPNPLHLLCLLPHPLPKRVQNLPSSCSVLCLPFCQGHPVYLFTLLPGALLWKSLKISLIFLPASQLLLLSILPPRLVPSPPPIPPPPPRTESLTPLCPQAQFPTVIKMTEMLLDTIQHHVVPTTISKRQIQNQSLALPPNSSPPRRRQPPNSQSHA